jgi:hypothetical protein
LVSPCLSPGFYHTLVLFCPWLFFLYHFAPRASECLVYMFTQLILSHHLFWLIPSFLSLIPFSFFLNAYVFLLLLFHSLHFFIFTSPIYPPFNHAIDPLHTRISGSYTSNSKFIPLIDQADVASCSIQHLSSPSMHILHSNCSAALFNHIGYQTTLVSSP